MDKTTDERLTEIQTQLDRIEQKIDANAKDQSKQIDDAVKVLNATIKSKISTILAASIS